MHLCSAIPAPAHYKYSQCQHHDPNRKLVNRNDTDAIKRAYDDLQTKFQDVSAELYKQASAQAGPRPGPQPGPEAQPQGGAEEGAGRREGDVVDAEFEVVDENKKK